MIGTTLEHYRIIAKLGEGGMGEVYRARDTRLQPDIAIKVLPAHVANDPERLRRFQHRSGKPLPGPPVRDAVRVAWPRLAPDGKRVAFSQLADPNSRASVSDIWVHDLERNISSRLTFGKESVNEPCLVAGRQKDRLRLLQWHLRQRRHGSRFRGSDFSSKRPADATLRLVYGQRFIVITTEQPKIEAITVVLNWDAELKR